MSGIEVLTRNNTSYPVQVSARLRNLHSEYIRLAGSGDGTQDALAASALKYYQYLVRTVMTNPEYGIGENGNARGLLIYHTMGMGKTILAVATAVALWDVRAPIILAPKSLQKNFQQAIGKFIAIMNPTLTGPDLESKQAAAARRFRFVSLDAYNMATQIARVTSGVEGSGSLNNRLFIVDEAHNLFRAIINSSSGATNARRLYEMVMGARNLRILFLTGTPPSKDPFELVPCFNMLAGYDLLPVQYEVFYKNYVDLSTHSVKNREKLANRLLGLVSYVTHTAPTSPCARTSTQLRELGGFPEELKTIIERLEMSPEQYRQYLLAREKEETEGRGGAGGSAPDRIVSSAALSLPGAEAESGSTYHVKSRMLSNFAPPYEDKDREVSEMGAEAFTKESSVKAARLIENLASAQGPALVYSQFVDAGGLAVIARFLQKSGYGPYEADRRGPSYAVIAGDVKSEDRAHIQEVFNSPANAHGELIKVLLVSKTGAEGLDLKGVRQVHVFEPYWDKSREDQVKARGVRLGSHDHLPHAEREVQPFLYIAIANQKMFEGMRPTSKDVVDAPRRQLLEEQTIDERFHSRGLSKYALNLSFRRLLQDVSLECAVNGYGGCRLCVPTDAPLFHEDPVRDLRLPDPCRPLEESEVVANKITLPGEDGVPYFYRLDPAAPSGVYFFEYDDELTAYVPVDPASELFVRLYEALHSSDKKTAKGKKQE